ncbi:MAG: short-chain dehydrogenase [Solirubrobacterales bacterium]|nr:short-chain dehydrogenase [Solirubrobacterales bacterium]
MRDHGFTVLAGARNPGEVVADERLVPLRLDVRDADSVGAALAGIEANPGSLDVLVNNAGIYGEPTGAADYDLGEANEVIETNVFGPWRLIQASLPLLRRSDSPRIVNVSSGAGQLAEMGGGRAAYRLSKAALNALTRTLAADEPQISVNSVCPGWVRTDMGGSSAPRSVEEGADTAVWLATMADDVPSGGFFRNREPIPW